MTILSHGEDPDGIISAALVARYTQEKVNSQNIIFASYAAIPEAFEQARQRCLGQKLYVADLNFDNQLKDNNTYLLRCIVNRSQKVIWIDEHSGSRKHKPLLDQLGIETILSEDDISAARLIQENYLPQDKYAAWIAGIAQTNDNPQDTIPNQEQCDLGITLQRVISLYNIEGPEQLYPLTRAIAQDNNWYNSGKFNSDINAALARYTAAEQQAKACLEASLETKEIAGRRFVVGYGSGLLPSKEILRELRERYKEADHAGYLVIFGPPQNNVLFFRNPNSDFNAESFCTHMKGGGRGGDGGFGTKQVMSTERYPTYKEQVVTRLVDYLTATVRTA